jgi:DNA-binding beta-propeller fold protein YncE
MRPPSRKVGLASILAAGGFLLALLLAGCSQVEPPASAAPQTIPFEFIAQWGMPGDAPGQLNDPVGPALDGFGRVYLVNRASGFVQKFEASGDPLLSFDADGARRASAVAVDAGGGIYVANAAIGEMRIYFPEGDLLRSFPIPPQRNLEGTFGFSIADDGTVYVPDAAGGRILALSSQGRLERSWKVPPAAGGRLAKPTVATIGPDGFLYVGDSQGDRVVKFTREGMQVATWDDSADEPAPVLGLAVSSNSVFMLRGGSPRVIIWTLDGKRRFADNLGGRLDAAPKGAGSLVVNTASGELIVVDPSAPRVLRFRIHL